MALFGKKKTETATTEAAAKTGGGVARDLSHILSHARITEKATVQAEGNIYTFDVSRSATKRDIVQAVRALYKVTPTHVRVLTVPQKIRRNARTGRIGIKSGGKKAYVFLKKGETITIS
jgi:large subunit ribosomal protein L23